MKNMLLDIYAGSPGPLSFKNRTVTALRERGLVKLVRNSRKARMGHEEITRKFIHQVTTKGKAKAGPLFRKKRSEVIEGNNAVLKKLLRERFRRRKQRI